MKYKLLNAFVIALMLFQAVAPIGALAYTATDQSDYAPGAIVMISGDNSDGTGFAAGDVVHVEVSGPNGPVGSCDADAVDNGVWSCQFQLPADAADGNYSYDATGGSLGVSQSGGFTVTAPPPPPPLAIPSIQSDKDDYAPGELVTLTGGNWQGDTQVRIFVNDNVAQTWSRDVIVDVAADGRVTDSFNLPNWFVATYVVSASGQQTGRVVTTTFTDSVTSVTIN